MSATARPIASQSPTRVAIVWPARRWMVCWSTRCSLMLERSTMCPDGVITALNPVGAAWTTQRPVSIARRRDDAICWLWMIDPWNEAPFVGLSSTSPPPLMAARARSAKKISHEMSTPSVPAGVCSTGGS
jgi:hypothetical protein